MADTYPVSRPSAPEMSEAERQQGAQAQMEAARAQAEAAYRQALAAEQSAQRQMQSAEQSARSSQSAQASFDDVIRGTQGQAGSAAKPPPSEVVVHSVSL